eukprot:1106820-Amorphochlora_amoeboformis.AAC.1
MYLLKRSKFHELFTPPTKDVNDFARRFETMQSEVNYSSFKCLLSASLIPNNLTVSTSCSVFAHKTKVVVKLTDGKPSMFK